MRPTLLDDRAREALAPHVLCHHQRLRQQNIDGSHDVVASLRISYFLALSTTTCNISLAQLKISLSGWLLMP